jgi:hypothetical protein
MLGAVVIVVGAPVPAGFAPPAAGAAPVFMVVAMPPVTGGLAAAPAALLLVGLAPVEPAAAVLGCVVVLPGVTPAGFPPPPQAAAMPKEIDKLHRNKLRIVGSCYSLHTANRARARDGAMT